MTCLLRHHVEHFGDVLHGHLDGVLREHLDAFVRLRRRIAQGAAGHEHQGEDVAEEGHQRQVPVEDGEEEAVEACQHCT